MNDFVHGQWQQSIQYLLFNLIFFDDLFSTTSFNSVYCFDALFDNICYHKQSQLVISIITMNKITHISQVLPTLRVVG